MADVLGTIILWLARLVGLYLVVKFLKNFRPNIFYKGWSNLRQRYAVADVLPAPLRLQSTSARIGSEVYGDTMRIALDEEGVYLQRFFLFKARGTLRIPYPCFRLWEPPKARGPFGLRVYGIFEVDGVDIWLDDPYATSLLARLPTAP